ncbi:alanine racemase [uncultured Pseudokineococcus sp.]|uniref:alanine racemase n=1 Tax=uncultured Pseudokineococcus sp. TaxID=1642928 RepID=UPI00262D6BB4|nr:alanine racemase [uncultured Pseudokineococcus sp.]
MNEPAVEPAGTHAAPAGDVLPGDVVPGGVLPARAVVDLDAVAANTGVLRERAGGAAVMAVVKADGYGHGMVPAALAALAGGATWLGVAHLAEALELRAAGVHAPVLAWLVVPGQDLAPAVAAGVDVSASAVWALEALADAARRSGRTARVHLKVDTGLSRGGATADDWPALVRAAAAAQAEGAVEVVAVWSHLASADDEASDDLTLRQVERLSDAVEVAARCGVRPSLRHLAASSGVLAHPAAHLDLVRPGVAVYGVSPAPQRFSAADVGLVPAMSLRARLALVKEVGAGEGVSYGHSHVTGARTRLALVPLGYGDGLPRHASGRGPVALAGRRYAVAGRVCMDQVVLDLGDDEAARAARAGDEVEVFGSGADGGPTAQDWADAAGTIAYEVVTRIGARVPRVHVGAVAEQHGLAPARRPSPVPAPSRGAGGVR